MTKAEKKQIEAEMEQLARRARTEVQTICANISWPYQLEALKTLRNEIDTQIEAIESAMEYAKNNKI